MNIINKLLQKVNSKFKKNIKNKQQKFTLYSFLLLFSTYLYVKNKNQA